jgi:hypothetical protein
LFLLKKEDPMYHCFLMNLRFHYFRYFRMNPTYHYFR